jgi:hypothetical protein
MRTPISLSLTLLVAAACRTVPATPMLGGTSAAGSVGAATPARAVEMMLAAATLQDIQAISAVWGDEKGMTRDRIARDELEKRTLIMICVLGHEKQTIGAPQQLPGNRYLIPVDLTQKEKAGSTTFTVARMGDGRWVVSDVNLVALQNNGFCAR